MSSKRQLRVDRLQTGITPSIQVMTGEPAGWDLVPEDEGREPTAYEERRDVLRERLSNTLRAYDTPRAAYIDCLLHRATKAMQPDVVLDKVEQRLLDLEERFRHHSAESLVALDHLDAALAPNVDALQAAAERGDFRRVLRAASRYASRTPRLARVLSEQHASRLGRLASRDNGQQAATAHLGNSRSAKPLSLDEALRMYEKKLDDSKAHRSLQDTSDTMPTYAGPYHGITVAVEAMQILDRLSPELFRAWHTRLRSFELPEPQAVAKKKKTNAARKKSVKR